MWARAGVVPAAVPGTRGYAEAAGELVARYEQVAFDDKHRAVLHVIPAAPADVLDLGAGTGADAAWLAAQGHRVLAVEPVAALREAGRALHGDSRIEWLDDGLPDLQVVVAAGRRFDLVMVTAVWMHLDAQERHAAMPVVAALLRSRGVLTMSLRHGPVPAGRQMFEVDAIETVTAAGQQGLRVTVCQRVASVQPANRAAGVSWTQLAFVKGA